MEVGVQRLFVTFYALLTRTTDFQYRFPSTCEPEPAVLERVPIPLATF